MPARAPRNKLPATPEDLPPYIVAAGGQELIVAHVPHRDEPVRVALLKAAAYPDFLAHLVGSAARQVPASDERLAELVCHRPSGWADTLHPLSLQEIKEAALQLNFTGAQKWAENQMLLMEANQEATQRHPQLAPSASSNGSTTSPSSAPTS